MSTVPSTIPSSMWMRYTSCSLTRQSSTCILPSPLQHAELTDAFKSYLEHKGLHEYQLATKLIWVVFALLCKSFNTSSIIMLRCVGIAAVSRSRGVFAKALALADPIHTW